jgi:hypothetical protein
MEASESGSVAADHLIQSFPPPACGSDEIWRPWVAKIQDGLLLKDLEESNALAGAGLKLKDAYFRATTLKCSFCPSYSQFLHGEAPRPGAPMRETV